MPWIIEYFEEEDGTQPAEVFEDALDSSADRDTRKIGGKLIRVMDQVAQDGFRTGGGYAEACHDVPGIWQMNADVGRKRGREFFAFDADKVILLGGALKGPREPTPPIAYAEARRCLDEYEKTGRVSPEEADDEQV